MTTEKSEIRISNENLNVPFAMIPHSLSRDESLTWGARGVLQYLIGLPVNWRVSVAHLSKQSDKSDRPTKEDGIRSILKELISKGYMQRIRETNPDGTVRAWVYNVANHPKFKEDKLPEYPEAKNTNVDNNTYPSQPDGSEPELAETPTKNIYKKEITKVKKKMNFFLKNRRKLVRQNLWKLRAHLDAI